MRVQIEGESRGRLDAVLQRAVEACVYIYAFCFFFDKGEGLRNIGLYGSFAAWTVLSLRRRTLLLPKGQLAWAFLALLLAYILSSAFSILPRYSLYALKGDVLEGCVMFAVVGGLFGLRELHRLGLVLSLAGAVLLVLGLHGFLTGADGFYTSENAVLFADKNKFGYYLGYIFPFFMLLAAGTGADRRRALGAALCLWGVAAGVLSASRAGMLNIISSASVFAALRLRRGIAAMAAAVIVLAVIVALMLPYMPTKVRGHFEGFWEHMKTFNMRTSLFWVPVLESVAKRPVLGWGYGAEVYRDPRPFQDTSQPGWGQKGGLHSIYYTVLFHQGLIGLAAYIGLISAMSVLLQRKVRSSSGDERLLAAALLGVAVGTFVVHGALHVVYFRMLGLTAGMAAALLAAGRAGRVSHDP